MAQRRVKSCTEGLHEEVLKLMCPVLKVSRSGYSKWRSRTPEHTGRPINAWQSRFSKYIP